MEKLFTINGHTRELLFVVVVFFLAILMINKAISLFFDLMNFLYSTFKSIIFKDFNHTLPWMAKLLCV